MEIRDSARRHGIADSDIHHAIGNAVAAGRSRNERRPDRWGAFHRPRPHVEVISVEDIDDGEVAIHAMQRRTASEGYLPREDRP